MKPLLTFLMMFFCVLFFSCSKRSGTDPASPPPPETPAVPVIERLTFRQLEDNDVVEEIYSFTYDADGRLTICNRVDKNMPYIKVNYSGSNVSSVVAYTTIGTIGATYLANQSLFIKQDTISFYHTFDISPADPLDTAFQEYVFKDSALMLGTIRYGSQWEDFRSTYNNMICKYDDDKNLTELGFVNTSQQYVKQMDVLASDDKINPIRYVSPVMYLFVIFEIDAELLHGRNNITSVRYADGRIAELEFTYNEKGFPLTVKEKSQSFVKYEFQYR